MTAKEYDMAFREMSAAYVRNRPAFPLDELEKYRDHYVAWNPEVTTIIAAVAKPEEIDPAIVAAGYDPGLCVVEFIQ